MPQLTIASATSFLARAGIRVPHHWEDRPLRGLLAADQGNGFILIDADDDDAERRVTLAHELAHFLRDYLDPRQRAANRLGPAINEVFDGVRAATFDERLAAALRGVTVGCHFHLLAREIICPSAIIRDAEAAADRLAFELLAPFDAVAMQAPTDPASLATRLVTEFGLPPQAARNYAAILLPSPFAHKI
jgi:hypothetical protein